MVKCGITGFNGNLGKTFLKNPIILGKDPTPGIIKWDNFESWFFSSIIVGSKPRYFMDLITFSTLLVFELIIPIFIEELLSYITTNIKKFIF